MGGQAFTKVQTTPPIIVPRMSPDLYQRMVELLRPKLEASFSRVSIPREAPGKPDYGDVDFIVQGIGPGDTCAIWQRVATTLGAQVHVQSGNTVSFAVQHPDRADAHVQVDVELAPGDGTPDGPALFAWTTFMKGDADLVQILGICHRSLGLTCNDQGLHLRVEEVEPHDKRKSLLFLTRDPGAMLEFYGLDAAKHAAGFRDEVDLFHWVTRGRFFSWALLGSRTEKAKDRARIRKRAMYRRFVEEYRPPAQESAAGPGQVWSRKQVLEEALAFFGKHAQHLDLLKENNTRTAEKRRGSASASFSPQWRAARPRHSGA